MMVAKAAAQLALLTYLLVWTLAPWPALLWGGIAMALSQPQHELSSLSSLALLDRAEVSRGKALRQTGLHRAVLLVLVTPRPRGTGSIHSPWHDFGGIGLS